METRDKDKDINKKSKVDNKMNEKSGKSWKQSLSK